MSIPPPPLSNISLNLPNLAKIRTYVTQLQGMLDRGLNWVVFEQNTEALWARVRSVVSTMLYNEWKRGLLLGTKAEQAFYVKCDRTVMTQNDLDNGRLICLVGVAPVKPAEFVVIQLSQMTAGGKKKPDDP